MPSRMVPAQQLSELSDEMVRLAAAKDAEISEHIEQRRMLARKLLQAAAEIAALTDQRDVAVDDRNRHYHAAAEATEQRDRAMKIVRRATAAWDQLQRMYDGQDAERQNSGEIGSRHRDIFEAWLDSLTEDAKEIAALDAEAAAETAPSLPETPE